MKNFRKILSAVLCIIVVCVSLSSCSGDIDTFKSADGVEHKIVRDEKNNIILNENGELAVYVTNENGKIMKDDSGKKMVEYISFDGLLYDNGKVESKDISYTLPRGFAPIQDTSNYFEYEGGKGQIFVSYTDTVSSTDMINYLLNNCKKMQEEYGADLYTYEQEVISAKNTEVKAIKIVSTAPGYNKNMTYYCVDVGSGFYRFNCSVAASAKNKVNFDSFAKSIEIKE